MEGLAELACAIMPLSAFAQPSDTAPRSQAVAIDRAVHDITVTAREKTETVQDVRVAVAALDANALTRMGADSLASIVGVPNVTLASGQMQPSGLVVFIRCIGNKAQDPFVDMPIAVSVGGIYFPISTGSLVDLFEVEQVEVLRSPLGPLQRRNSPSWAVNITTRRPTEKWGHNGEIGFSRFYTIDAKAAVNLPLAQGLAMRLSGVISYGGGQNYNVPTGKHKGDRGIFGGHVALSYKLAETLSIFLSGDFAANRSEQPGMRAVNDPKRYSSMPTFACATLGYCENLPHDRVNIDNDRTFFSNSGGMAIAAQKGYATADASVRHTLLDGTLTPLPRTSWAVTISSLQKRSAACSIIRSMCSCHVQPAHVVQFLRLGFVTESGCPMNSPIGTIVGFFSHGGDIDRIKAHIAKYFCDETRWEHTGATPTTYGVQEAIDFVDRFAGLGDHERMTIRMVSIAADGDVVLSERINTFHMPAGQPDRTLRVMAVHEVRDGKIIQWREYFDTSAYDNPQPADNKAV